MIHSEKREKSLWKKAKNLRKQNRLDFLRYKEERILKHNDEFLHPLQKKCFQMGLIKRSVWCSKNFNPNFDFLNRKIRDQ